MAVIEAITGFTALLQPGQGPVTTIGAGGQAAVGICLGDNFIIIIVVGGS